VYHIDEVQIDGKIMFLTALFGVLVNVTMMYFLHSKHTHEHDHGHKHTHDHKKMSSDYPENFQKDGVHAKMNRQQEPILNKEFGEFEAINLDNEIAAKKATKCASYSSLEQDLEKENRDQIRQELPQFPLSPILNPSNEDNIHSNNSLDDHIHDHLRAGKYHNHEKDMSKNINLRATALHIFGDLLQSLGVLMASILIWYDNSLKLADPICTYIFSFIVLITTIPITKDCIHVLMESTPKDINLENFEAEILRVNGIVDLHDIHVWSLSEGKQAMSAHVTADIDPQSVLDNVTKICRDFGITHSTVQIEKVEKHSKDFIMKCEQFIH